MTETARLGLPLLAPAQAQKHVTVNEALTRLDGLAHLSLKTIGTQAPPVSPAEGEVHGVGAGATGLWAGEDGALAVFQNGGWAFVTPRIGWQGWSETDDARVVFDGADWVPGAGALTANGAGFVHRSVELDHAVAAGANSNIAAIIPAGALVYGVTGRVVSAIGGASSFEIGVAGSVNRYGSGIGVSVGSWARGLTSSPLAYYSDSDLVLTATGGNFDGTGVLRLAIHFAELTLPRA